MNASKWFKERFSAKKKQSELPSSYFVGERYVKDTNRIEVEIQASFFYSGMVSPLVFFHHGHHIMVRQNSSVLTVHLKREISKNLWMDISKNHQGERFILGYLWKILPRVNQEILKQKYTNGHLLMKTISTLDIANLVLAWKGKKAQIHWPLAIGNFPIQEEFVGANKEMYVRDFIDAITAYLETNYDDCIRKLITATENFFRANHLSGNGFKNIIEKNISGATLAQRSIKSNLFFIYKLRNKIVHSKFRINPSNKWICHKAIGTIKYLFGSPLNTTNPYAGGYISRISMQFGLLRDFVGDFMNLDDIERMEENGPKEPTRESMINNQEDLDRWMFTSLEITEKERSMILRGSYLD